MQLRFGQEVFVIIIRLSSSLLDGVERNLFESLVVVNLTALLLFSFSSECKHPGDDTDLDKPPPPKKKRTREKKHLTFSYLVC